VLNYRLVLLSVPIEIVWEHRCVQWLLERVDAVMPGWLVLHFAFRSLLIRRIRSALALASISLGVFAIVAIVSTGRTLVEAQRRTYADTAQPDIVATVPSLTPGLVATLSRRDGVVAVEARTVQPSRVSAGGRWIPIRLVGIARFDAILLDQPRLVRGRWPERGEIVLDASAPRLLGVDIGSLVALQANPGEPITYARVSGFAWVPARPDAALLDRLTGFVPDRELRQQLGIDSANTLLVKVAEPALASRVATELQRFLAARQVQSYGWTVRDPESFLGARELRTLIVLLRAFAVLGSAVALFIVANTTIGLLTEERPQLGTLRALGATRWQLFGLYASPYLLLGACGGLVGFGLGEWGARLLSRLLAGLAGLVLPSFTFSWGALALALSVGVGIAVLGSLVPLLVSVRWSAASLLHGDVRTTLVAPRALAVVTRWLGRWSPVVAMSVRDPFRRPLRTVLTVAASAVALGAVLASQLVDHSLRVTVADLYTRYRADAWMLVNPPVPPTYAHRLEQLQPVRAAEPWTMTQGAVGATRTDVWGLPADTVVYEPRLVAGEWLQPTWPPGAVLTANLAERVDVHVGDVVPLDLGRRRVPVRVVGIVDDESTYLGATTIGKVFIERRVLQSLLGQEDRPSLYALLFWEHAPARAAGALAAVEQHERSLRPLTLLMADDRAATERVLAVLTVLARAVVLVVAAVAVFGIGNALLLDISERRREIGVLRTIGAEWPTLGLLLAGEALVIVALGAVLAYPLGAISGAAVLDVVSARLFRVPLTWNPWAGVLVIAAALVAAGGAVLVPLAVATRIRPVEVLRYE